MKNNLFKRLLVGTCTVCMLLFTSLPVMAAEYPDVTTGAWYYSYVQDVSDKGLMSGYNDGRFGPNDKLTRGQFATVLWRMNGSPDMGSSSFADVPATSFYAKASEWARVNGVITGYSDGRFGGNDNINREQVATILYRYSGGEATGNIWEYPDGSSVSTFAREGMAYAVGNGIISGDNGYLNPQGDVVRAVAATMISRFNSSNKQHTYDAGVETKAPTCDAEGVRTYTCTVCQQTKTEAIPALGHTYDAGVETKAPTCTTDGVKTFTCSRCTDTYTKPVKALGHDYNETTTDATCTTAGSVVTTCSRCDYHNSKPINAKGHSMTDIYRDVFHPAEYKEVKEDHIFCGQCGIDFGADAGADTAALEHTMDSPNCKNYHSRPVYVNKKVKDEWTEKVFDHSECTVCGAR